MAEIEEVPNQEQPEEPAQEAGLSYVDDEKPQDDLPVESESEDETEASVPDETSEGEQIASISQLMEHEEWDPEWFDSLKVPVKVDGQPAEATFKDLVASYQIQEAAKHRLDDAKAQAQALKQEAAQGRETLKTELGTAAGLVQLAEQLFHQDISNLQKLKEEDPQAYLVEKDRLSERRQALDQVKQNLKQSLQTAFDQQKPSAEVIESERQALIEKHPELEGDDARADLARYCRDQGFTQEEIGSQPDHRLFSLAHKAHLYDQLQAKAKTAKQKVAKIPKVMKPGSQKKKPEPPKDAASILYGN